jgi:serine/threonine protein kinase
MMESKGKPFSEEEAMNYFTMILIGLHALHSKNIYHRDLKPANILIDNLFDGTQILKIGDFGISKAADLYTMKLT